MGTKQYEVTTPSVNIADALFGTVRQRVLGLLFGNPDRSYYARELIHLAGSGSGAVQRELATLTAAGLISMTRIGNQTHYRADSASPVFDELRRLVLKTSGLVDVLRTALAPLAGEIRCAFVFGSVAKQRDSTSSDVDLLILTDRLGYPELFTQLESATKTLGRPTNPTVYTTDEFSKRVRAKHAFLKKILIQPKLWIIGNDRELPA